MPQVFSMTIKDNSAEVLSAMKSQVLLALESIGEEAEGYAKENCPVDTGRLRNSIAHQVVESEKAVYIGTNVEYAPYVEYGDNATHKTGGAHFLRDAATEHGEHYKQIMEAALNS